MLTYSTNFTRLVNAPDPFHRRQQNHTPWSPSWRIAITIAFIHGYEVGYGSRFKDNIAPDATEPARRTTSRGLNALRYTRLSCWTSPMVPAIDL
ncbi:hypothetical protein N7509_001455 [Penicillium cosmopolitanum]|uniref:Uncharacterized protein n=1 Tax=Penicillium cosmopolitanum TaxID=1131564 RepID=A0A9W9W743_9EURO|nr:uncharacterized protein N7509_001455 [Penicillium cosmopolitanum]KAJ5407572.1 hypothetical protein N7509_001455 [Penicillium cosmopolitanum]